MRATCSGLPPASATTATTFASVWRTWPGRSEARNAPLPSQPIWPATNTTRPSAATPLAYPRGCGRPGGCSVSTGLGLLARPQHRALHLAGRRTRERVEELDLARVLV